MTGQELHPAYVQYQWFGLVSIMVLTENCKKAECIEAEYWV